MGIDVGGSRKRFDFAVVDRHRLLQSGRGLCASDVADLINAHKPALVAIDSPRNAAADGHKYRPCEKELRDWVKCGIRWTPENAQIFDGRPYYEWIRCGFDLYKRLAAEQVIEVFPTASWTMWFGRREGTRAAWTNRGFKNLGLEGLPTRSNQDLRDSVAAAVTARQHHDGETKVFDETIVVPRGPWR